MLLVMGECKSGGGRNPIEVGDKFFSSLSAIVGRDQEVAERK